MLGICDDIERYCPDTFLINLTNPLSRVALAINTATSIRNVSMCHEFAGGLARIAGLLRIPKSKIAAKASGINHFTFFTEIRRSDTGEDLYPRLRRLWQRRYFDYPPPVTAAARQLVQGSLGPGGRRADVRPPGGPHVPGVRPAARARSTATSGSTCRSPRRWPAGTRPPSTSTRARQPVGRAGHPLRRRTSRVPMHRAGRSAEEVFPIIGAMWTDHPRRSTP